ncbi:MAG: hypothetical protein IID33_09585, partial [Planctomycetes bacterium]|nr:hypothetical protein [Planctomycetota bacterium]
MGRLIAAAIVALLCGGAIPACAPHPASVRLGRGGNIMLIIADDLGC